MTALTGSYGTQISLKESIGMNFKIFHQKLAEQSTGYESGKPYSTDFAFDVGYMKKFGNKNQHQFGLAIQNIGPPIDFLDAEQADPAPTNMRFGFYTEIYNDETNKIHFLFDANKLLVASYSEMDWNEDGLIGDGFYKGYADSLLDCNDCHSKEYSHTDEWYAAIGTAWLDDWYFGGDYDLYENQQLQTGYEYWYPETATISSQGAGRDYRIGGFKDDILEFSEHDNACPGGNCTIYVPNYKGFCDEDGADSDNIICYDENGGDPAISGLTIKYIDVPNDGIGECEFNNGDGSNNNGVFDPGEWTSGDCDDQDHGEIFYDYEIDENHEQSFDSEEYGVYNAYGDKEKGTGKDRKFTDELEEMIYNFGVEYWYTQNVAFRLGFIYDLEGNVKNPTLGLGVKFDKYGFDFGYTSGNDTDARSNTMFFSLSLGI